MYTKDGNDAARAIFDRHYSRIFYKDGRSPKLFVGPGEKIVLVLPDYSALFVWKKFIESGEIKPKGINCSVFRNESNFLSSNLILEAEEIAWERWPNERLYTYVNGNKIQSVNPGYCFKMAGWNKCGVSKGGLVILEKVAED